MNHAEGDESRRATLILKWGGIRNWKGGASAFATTRAPGGPSAAPAGGLLARLIALGRSL
jgi:hypothetical protein